MAAERWDEQVGSVADEATRLLEALRRSADDTADPRVTEGDAVETPGTPPVDGEAAPPTAGHDPACTWCPLCRSVAVLRSLSPETLVRLADLAGVAASVLTDLARSRAGSPPEDTMADEGATTAATTAAAAGPSTAEAHRIPVLDADDPQEAPRD